MTIGYDVLGNIAIIKFDRIVKKSYKKKFALDFLNKHKNISTVLEKSGKFSGRLRTQNTTWLAGNKTKEALYKENGCEFRLNVDTCYFSPRLSEERKLMLDNVKKNDEVIVMFAGVGPFSVVIGKKLKVLKGKGRVVSLELGKECSKYAEINVKRNKLENVKVIQGNVKNIGIKFLKNENFDKIIMARPNLKETFLKSALRISKKNTMIYYHAFCKKDELDNIKNNLEKEAKEFGKKVKFVKIRKAGDIGAHKWRWQIDMKVLN